MTTGVLLGIALILSGQMPCFAQSSQVASQSFPANWCSPFDSHPPQPPLSSRETSLLARWGPGRCDLVSADSLYICMRNGSLLEIHSATMGAPSEQSLLNQQDFPVSEASQILLVDHTLWIAAGPEGLLSVELDGGSPPVITTHTLDNGAWRLFECQGMLGVLNPQELLMLDPVIPQEPVEVAQLALFQSHFDAACDGRWLYLAAGANDLRILDLQDPTNPVVIRTQFFPGGLYTIALGDTLLAAGSSSQSTGLLVMNRSRPDSVTLLGNTPLDFARDLMVLEASVLASTGTGGLKAMALDSAGAPQNSQTIFSGQQSWQIEPRGRSHFLLGQEGGLSDWEILAPPFVPQPLITYETGAEILAAGILQDQPWLLDAEYGIRLLNLNESRLLLLDEWNNSEFWQGAISWRDRILVWNRHALHVLGVAQNTLQSLASYEPESEDIDQVVLAENRIVVLKESGELILQELDSPTPLTVLDEFSPNTEARQLLGSETDLWVLDVAGDLQIYGLDQDHLEQDATHTISDYSVAVRSDSVLFLQQSSADVELYVLHHAQFETMTGSTLENGATAVVVDQEFLHFGAESGLHLLNWQNGFSTPAEILPGYAEFYPLFSDGWNILAGSEHSGLLYYENLAANRPPQWQFLEMLQLVEDSLSTFSTMGWALDPENDNWSLQVHPHDWLLAESTAGQLTVEAASDRWGLGTLWFDLDDGRPNGKVLMALQVDVAARNDSPYALADTTQWQVDEDDSVQSFVLTGLFSDADNDSLVYTVDTCTMAMTEIDGSQLLFTPFPDSSGTVVLSLGAEDPAGLEAFSILEVLITAQPDCPELLAQPIAGVEDELLLIPGFRQWLVDADGESPGICGISAPSGQALDWSWHGDSLALQPPNDAYGEQTLNICITDGICTVNDSLLLTLAGRNDCPDLCGRLPIISLLEDQVVLLADPVTRLLRSICDVDGDSLFMSRAVLGNSDFNLVETDSGTVIQPPADFNGVITLNLRLSDGQCSSGFQLALDYQPQPDSLRLEVLVPCGRVASYELLDSIAIRLWNPDQDQAEVRWFLNNTEVCSQTVSGLSLGWRTVHPCITYLLSGSEAIHVEVIQGDTHTNEGGADCHWVLPLSAIHERAELPQELVLRAPWPNPFNPTLQLEFGLPKSSHTELAVYNILGMRVALLEDQLLQAGWHQYKWTAEGLAAGIYFVVLRSADTIRLKRILLLK